jgi:hypothetical protein
MKSFTIEQLLEFGNWCRTGLSDPQYSSLSNSGLLYKEWCKTMERAKFKDNLKQARLWANARPGDILKVISKDSRSKIELGEKLIVKKIWYSTRAFDNQRAEVYEVQLKRTRKSSIKNIKISVWTDGLLINSGWLFQKSNSK